MAWHVFSLLLYRQIVLSFALCKSVHSFEKLVFCRCIIFNSINIPSKGNVPASASSVHEMACSLPGSTLTTVQQWHLPVGQANLSTEAAREPTVRDLPMFGLTP